MEIKLSLAAIRRITFAVCATALALATAQAQVSLPNVLSDHMVLQRESPIHIWGKASPAEHVTVRFKTQTEKATADSHGKWSLYLAPEQAGGPYTLTVVATNTITLSDVLVGDVWIASGQSNMQMPLEGFGTGAPVKNGPQEIAQANQPAIRLLRLSEKTSQFPLDDQPAHWTTCTPDTAMRFSAVAYFFGRELAEREHVPIGLIESSWGGTLLEAWTSLDALSADPALMPVFHARSSKLYMQSNLAELREQEAREDQAAKDAHLPPPTHPKHPTSDPTEPAGIYHGMIAPLIPLQIKGVIWYQGESNAQGTGPAIYSHLFQTMISDWRAKFAQGNFPFLFVQLANFGAGRDSFWGQIRDAQRRALDLVDTGMAVALDVGQAENIHPADKLTVGHRLALAARGVAYHEAIEFSGPLFRQAETARDGTALRVRFQHAEDGLNVKGPTLLGFEIAGADHHFLPAQAEVDGRSIVVKAPEVTAPKYVRYGWQNLTGANLYNGSGLPAATFTSEDVVTP